ncbi:MAG TPA: IS982 family transposase, partial [Streptosporangiaceae bacterium]|nr:IS982 family transposase [Streptosporangiaceae bacterium]
EGIYARITQRLLAMAAAIWHNWAAGETVKRSLISYDH